MNTDAVIELIRNSDNIAILTGAGVSTDSGISDFRSPSGTYARWDANRVFDIDYFHRDPAYFFDFAREELYAFTETQPNVTHHAITRLEQAGKLKACITQNIDMLHQRAGTKNVFEVHGSIAVSHCLGCGREFDIEAMRAKLNEMRIPSCRCGGTIKPDIVFFGEALPEVAIAGAFEAASTCDLFIAIGTSLVVYPAAAIPARARYTGAKLVIINREPTPLDTLADHVLNGELKDIVQSLSG
ncbi:Sir2 family NAD-dependent protein deacetylase [bacterium]|nr:Sir2 family NAD-dependent protein deacetylase [bacterium]